MSKRDRDMQVNLEPEIHQIVVELAKKLGQSQSTYIRRLIVNDLRDRGVLPDALLADILVPG